MNTVSRTGRTTVDIGLVEVENLQVPDKAANKWIATSQLVSASSSVGKPEVKPALSVEF